jgi:hypothetical protein
MKFKVGNIVVYNGGPYSVIECYDGCIQLHSVNTSWHHGVTLVQGEKDYDRLRLYLPEILKKL